MLPSGAGSKSMPAYTFSLSGSNYTEAVPCPQQAPPVKMLMFKCGGQDEVESMRGLTERYGRSPNGSYQAG